MMSLSLWIRNLRNKLFPGRQSQPIVAKPTANDVLSTAFAARSQTAQISKQRDPYFIQIGFDFGTCYSKCVCRDVMTNKAWVYFPDNGEGQELPFLIPGTLLLKESNLTINGDPANHYPENGLYHLKPALVKVALRQWDDPLLTPYRDYVGSSDPNLLSEFIEGCAVFFLARALGDVRAKVRRRLPDYGSLPQDYMAVNLAVPVADVERPEVNSLFQRILVESWGLAEKFSGYQSLSLDELTLLRRENNSPVPDAVRDACFIYPEVSANVQGFVRSRVSSPGIYLFSDTGASTVDQGVFIFMRLNQEDHLTYLYGSVLPLGSSHIEQRAANKCGRTDRCSLEMWREKKETGGMEPELRKAREWIATKLSQGTEATLAFAKQKLYLRDQLNEIRLIFGGGGHCDHPYRSAVVHPFSGQLFRQPISPDVVGLPTPRDLELRDSEQRWVRRLSVAYGLSFEKSELTNFTYPKDVDIPKPEEIWSQRKYIRDAPSKDEC